MPYTADVISQATSTISNTQWGAIVVILGAAVLGLFWLLMKSQDKRFDDANSFRDKLYALQDSTKATLDAIKEELVRRRR